MEAITVSNLTKSYGEHIVLKGVSFSIQQGEIFGLLGKNGAGKTTTLECIEGLRTYEGNITLHGSCGVQLQSSSLPSAMKAKEAIQFFGKWKKAPIDESYLNRIGVTPFLNKQYQQLSTGQKRRLNLAIAMLNNPDILFLDEPTAGLDVEGRASLHEEIRRLKNLGKTIIIASHDMAEVEDLCDRIAIMKEGSILFMGNPQDLQQHQQHEFMIEFIFEKALDLSGIVHGEVITHQETRYCVATAHLNDAILEIVGIAKEQGNELLTIKVQQDNLEQKFLSVIKENS